MKQLIALLLAAVLVLAVFGGCTPEKETVSGTGSTGKEELGGDDDSFGDSLEDMDVYTGYFEEETVDVTVTCESGTPGCYTLEGNTLTFTQVREDSVYSVSGQLRGNIVIDVGDDFKFDLELHGLALVSDTTSAITVLSGDEVSITAKKDCENYIYDTRDPVDDTDESQYSAAIYSLADLEICGKGTLTLISEKNNGIHSKDDLQVKNLTLMVACVDNALKGNDSVEITSANTTLIATQGDCIKTTNSDISGKGNQRGNITISGGTHTLYAACDGIDAAYNAVIEEESTELSIFTDKYSNYSSEVTAVEENVYYIRFTSNAYRYSVKYYNADDDWCWVNAEYHSKVSGGRANYYYYSFPKIAKYSKMQFFIYSEDQQQSQEEDYLVSSDYLTPNSGYDTFALTSSGGGLYYEWTNYSTNIQEGGFGGHGGMNEGNKDKGDHSAKGIKAANEVLISGGTVNIKSYDDAIHANAEATLENGETPTGHVTVSGGNLTLYSNDDGIHADGILTVSGGTIRVTNSYEGMEGTQVVISGGDVSLTASDDGVNATATSGNGVTISGGRLYIFCGGDGIDANSRTAYSGIRISGGKTVVISTSGGNSAIDTEQGYEYTGGSVVAVMPVNGMTTEATHCTNFSSIATSSKVSLNSGSYLTVSVSGTAVAAVRMTDSISAMVIYLGSNSADISSEKTVSVELDQNGVFWAD